MLRKFVSWVILLLITAVVVSFAVANRNNITVNLDPVGITNPPLTASLKLWVLALGMAILGVIIGGIAVWLRQGRWRRNTRSLDREVRALRAENQDLRQRLETAEMNAAPPPGRKLALRSPAA
jgi:uncharacterized integral membrane protein